MEINELFYAWVPRYVRYAILVLMIFVVLCANGVYNGITGDMYNDLGVYSEPYTMALNAVFAGMGTGMIFFIRLGTRITGKTLVVFGLFAILVLNIVCATTDSPAITVAACFILGFCKVSALGEIYLAWLKIWSKTFNAARLYPFLYLMALGGLYFASWMVTRFSYLYSWRYAYIAICILVSLSIILAICCFERHPLKRRIPLYQLDLPGLLLLSITLMLINYVAVYGKVEDWFASNAIVAASFLSAITLVLFIRRELTVKRPLLHFDLFGKPNLVIGLVLLAVLGVFTPNTFQSSFSGTVLHFESIRNAEINMFLIPGIVAGCVLSFFWYRYDFSGHLLTIIGMTIIVFYHILMYGRFVNDLSIGGFWLPSFFKGLGLAILYISIGLYTTKGFAFPIVMKVVGMAIIVRSFLAPGVFSGLYTYFLYAERTRHLSRLASEIDANEPMIFQYRDIGGYFRNIQQQANLTALKEISGIIIIFGLVVIAVLILSLFYRKMKTRRLATS